MVAEGSLAALLMIEANTGRGRLFAALALLTAVLPLATTLTVEKRAARWTACAIGGFACWIALAISVLALTPNGGPQHGPRVMHGFAETGRHFLRYSVSNLLPEGDQLQLGFTIMPLIDPLLTTNQAAKLKGLTASIYEELERDPEFRELGSTMSDAYGELLGCASESGHAYVYLPQGVDIGRPLPVLVFFHGSGGNFKAYLWVLSKLADKLGYALVIPSNGLGNWTEESSAKGLADALTAVSRVASVDRGRIHIMGLSNGGLAVSHLAEAQGSHFESMIFLSPVFATPAVRSVSFAAQCAGRPMIVLTGNLDDRVPLSYVEENAERMKRNGAQVTLKSFEDADHFLVFSHRDALLPLMESWLRSRK